MRRTIALVLDLFWTVVWIVSALVLIYLIVFRLLAGDFVGFGIGLVAYFVGYLVLSFIYSVARSLVTTPEEYFRVKAENIIAEGRLKSSAQGARSTSGDGAPVDPIGDSRSLVDVPLRLANVTGLAKLVVVFSPQGGAGRTTIAANLAVALHQSSKKPVALMDGSLPFGAIAAALNINPNAKTIADLLVVGSSENIDSEVLESVLVSHSTGIKVLLAPPTPESTELVTGAIVKRVLHLLRQRYYYIVVDTWLSFQEPVIAMLDMADLIVVPMTVEVPSIKNVRIFLQIAEKLGYPGRKVQLVANRFDPADGITLVDAEASIGKQFMDVLAYDRRPLVSAMNRGIPVVAIDNGSRIARDILRLTEKLAVVSGASVGRKP